MLELGDAKDFKIEGANKIVDLVRVIRAWELDPKEILSQEALNNSDESSTLHKMISLASASFYY